MSLGKSLDQSLNVGEEVRFKQKYKKLMINLSKICRLSYDEVEHLAVLYYKLQLVGEGREIPVYRSVISELMHNGFDMTDYTLIHYMFGVVDKSLSPYMSLENWVKMMSLLLRGSNDEKIKFCYSVYLTAGITDKLVRNTLVFLMKRCLFKEQGEPDEEGVKDLVDMIIKRMDKDRDGKISFDDYEQTIRENSGFLECFGPLLPNRLATYAFKTTFISKLRKSF